jgi:hypothetical protein
LPSGVGVVHTTRKQSLSGETRSLGCVAYKLSSQPLTSVRPPRHYCGFSE